MLGSSVGGGRRRAVRVDRRRLEAAAARRPRITILKRLGINTHPVTTATMPTTCMYSCDTMGRPPSTLTRARSLVARTVAAEGGGKNVDLMFVVAGGKDDTCDPGFPAHVTPVKHLSLAVWQE